VRTLIARLAAQIRRHPDAETRCRRHQGTDGHDSLQGFSCTLTPNTDAKKPRDGETCSSSLQVLGFILMQIT